MAKIQKYDMKSYITPNFEIEIEEESIEVIKVSELREWIDREKDRQNEMKLGTDSVVGAYYLGGLETINKLLVFFGTEEK